MQLNFYKNKILILSGAALFFIVIFSAYFSTKPYSTIQYVKLCGQNNAAEYPYQNPNLPIEDRVNDLMARMDNADKIGQMALVEKNSIHNLDDIAKYGLGALLSGGGQKPDDNTPAGWLEMVNNFQAQTKKTCLQIPLLYGVDANHGHGNVPGATIFPHFIGLGATQNAELVEEIAKATAEEAAATGIFWIFSPSLDVIGDTRWGRTYENFSSNPKIVGDLGKAYIEGIQKHSDNGLQTAASAKHYVGNGAMQWGTSINKNFFIDQGVSNLSEKELREIHLEPFRQAVSAGVKSIMVGLNTWQGEKVSANYYLINDILKGELGFQGFVFSDWYGVYEISRSKYISSVKAINAGVDMVMLPFDYKGFAADMQLALKKGDISQERIDDAVRRILKVKFEVGLFDQKFAKNLKPKLDDTGKNRALARKAVRESLVLMQNKNNTLPFSKNISRILVAGSAADNLGKQSGGWTVEWQGIDGNWIPGTTVLEGIKGAVSPDTEIQYDLNGNFADTVSLADIGIAVVGENPYTEGWGDNKNPELSNEDLSAITNLRKKAKKIIVIIISGRPLDIKRYAGNWDAVVAAWLPGTEGEGITDIIFGDYPFTGTLPVDWEI